MARYDFQSSLGSGQTKIENVITGEDFTALLTQTVDTLTRVAQSWSRGNVLNSSGIIETFETTLANAIPTTSYQRVFIDMCREAIDNADAKGGVDPILATELFTSLMTRVLRSNASGVSHVYTLQTLINEILSCRKYLRQVTRRCSNEDLRYFIDNIDRSHREMIEEALYLAGAEGRLSLQTSNVQNNVSTVSVQGDYVFDLVSPCLSVIDCSSISMDLPRVLIVDGFIGSVAEIDHILSAAVNEKQSLVIFARRFDPEVLTTISYNNRRGTFKVLPIIVPYDADSANVLKDIAVICNSTVISSLLGQLVTSVTFDELPTIDSLKAEHNLVHMENEHTTDSVRSYIENLRELLQRDDNSISHTFINRRIRCMSNRLINIRISDVNTRRVLSTDRSVRLINQALKHGIIRRFDIENCDLKLLKEINQIMEDKKVFVLDELDQLLLCVGSLVRLLGMSNCLLSQQ